MPTVAEAARVTTSAGSLWRTCIGCGRLAALDPDQTHCGGTPDCAHTPDNAEAVDGQRAGAIEPFAVNQTLPPNRRTERVVENREYAGFVRRIVQAHGRRIATGDVEGLADLVALARDIDTAIVQAITGLREFGYSWTEIAARLGVTRQAVQKRWGKAGEPPCR
jgi:hypothetical protein